MLGRMCRNIRVLLNFTPPATDEEVHAAALQYVRKVSGTSKPSKANEAAFLAAVAQIAGVTRALIDGLETRGEPKLRELEAAKAKARSIKRFSVKPAP